MKIKHIYINILFFIPIIFIICIRNYSYYWDGVDIAYYMEHPNHPKMFHQHHIAFAPFCYLIYSALLRTNLVFQSIDYLIVLNIISGTMFLLVCFMTFRVIYPDFRISGGLGVLLIGLSYTFGSYMRNSDQYIIPMLICGIIILRISSAVINRRGSLITWFDWFLMFCGVLMHQMTLLSLPALIYLEKADSKNKSLWRAGVRFHVSLAALLIVYLIFFMLTGQIFSLNAFYDWAIGYAKHPFLIFSYLHGFGILVERSFIESLYSTKALFIAPIERTSVLRLHEFIEVHYNQFLGDGLGWILFIVILSLIISGCIGMLKDKNLRPLCLFLLWWILPYIAFLQIFVPFQCFYKMFYLLPLVIIMMHSIEKILFKRLISICMTLLLASYMFCNIYFGFIPDSNPKNNPYLTFSYRAETESSKDDIFLLPDEDYFYGKYLRYFGDRDVAWVRRFAVEYYPQATFETVWHECNITAALLSQKYKNIYIPAYSPISDYYVLKILPLSPRDDIPDFLLLFPQQIRIMGLKPIGDKYFFIVSLEKFQPKSYTPE